MPKFKKHDIVKFGSLKGVVLTTKSSNVEYPLQVLFTDGKTVLGLRTNGRFGGSIKIMGEVFEWSTDKILKLVRRPRLPLLARLTSLFKRKKK